MTFDVRDKHGGTFTYVGIPRNRLNIFTISFGNCMHQTFMLIEDYLFLVLVLVLVLVELLSSENSSSTSLLFVTYSIFQLPGLIDSS